MNLYVFLYILYLCVVHCVALEFNNRKYNKKASKTVLFILILMGSLIAAFRPAGTQDTGIYNFVYQNSLLYLSHTKITSFLSLFANRNYQSIEIFYLMIMKCFRSYFETPELFYFVQGVISNALMIQGLYLLSDYIFDMKNEEANLFFCKNIILIYSLYQLFCGALYTSSAIRDGLSISLGIFAIANLLLHKRRLLSIAFFLLSILIHTTSIVLIAVYFIILLCKLKLRNKLILTTSLIIPFLYILKFGKFFVVIMVHLIETILKLLNIQAFYSYIRQLDYQLPKREGLIIIITCLILVLYSLYNKVNRKISKYIVTAVLGLLMFVLAYPITAFARLLYIFILFLIPLTMRVKKIKKIIYLSWGLYFIPQYVYVFGYFV